MDLDTVLLADWGHLVSQAAARQEASGGTFMSPLAVLESGP